MYRKVMIGSGFSAALVTIAYSVAVAMTASESIELPPRVGIVAVSLILGLGLTSTLAWIVQTANRESIRRDLPPIVAGVMRAQIDTIADEVANALAGRIDQATATAAARTQSGTVAAFREIVTSELITEQLNAAAQRIHRYGMITEASGRANGNVHSLRGN